MLEWPLDKVEETSHTHTHFLKHSYPVKGSPEDDHDTLVREVVKTEMVFYGILTVSSFALFSISCDVDSG